MSKELIAALEDIAATDEGRSGHKADRALHRHRSSVESVELPEGVRAAEARAVMNDDTIVYDATTVRSLIAAAVEREREQCHLIAEAEQLRREAIRYRKGEDHAREGGAASAAEQIAAAIRARGEK